MRAKFGHFRVHPVLTAMFAAAVLVTTSSSALAQKSGGKNPPTPPPPPTVYPYRYTDIGQPVYSGGGGQKSYDLTEPDALGELLIVGGGIATPSPGFVTVWNATAAGAIAAAPVPNSRHGAAAINDGEMIAFYGYSATQSAFVAMVAVPGVGNVECPKPNYRPQAINNIGDVVLTWSGLNRLWSLNPDGTTRDLVNLPDFEPSDINDWGVMAGRQLSTSSAAIAWFENGVLKIQTLPGLLPGNKGRGTGINNFGEVIGNSGGISPYTSGLPFLWSPTAGLIEMNPIRETGSALDINDRGEVVGWSIHQKYYGFLWKNGTFYNVNALNGASTATFQLGTAEAINNAGQIVGRSNTYINNKGAQTHSTYLLTPNP